MSLRPIKWNSEKQVVEVIDQRVLPAEEIWLEIKTYQEMADAIKTMVVRGAPLIGISAAYGMALAAKSGDDLKKADEVLRATRPTAVNLMWALDEVKNCEQNYEALLEKAHWILEDDYQRCKQMGEHGAKYIADKLSKAKKLRIMTHCNAGALATGGHGTALGVIRSLHEKGLVEMVYADETRPRGQGAKLTVWELDYDNIPVTLNTDNMSAYLMQQGKIDLVVVGSDRIAANGDFANKIGTYGLAIIAKHHDVPFFVAAPKSTFDMSLSDGSQIPIEERDIKEVTEVNEKLITIAGAKAVNPAFDVSPAGLAEAIFTEEGKFEPKASSKILLG